MCVMGKAFVLCPSPESLLSTLTYSEDGVNRAANTLESRTRASQGDVPHLFCGKSRSLTFHILTNTSMTLGKHLL